MYCTYCGKQIDEYTYDCPYCGEQQGISEEDLPNKLMPMGAWSYFGHSLLFSIPVIGTILLIIFACGGTKNINKRNYARSYFCNLAIVGIIILIVVAVYIFTGVSISDILNYYR